jgi:actin related protein 2/3 complex, subunit 2
MGSQAVIEREFPGMETTPDDGHSMAIQFDCDNLKNPKEFLEKVSDLRKLVFSGPMDIAFTALQKGTSRESPVIALEYRKNENMFICSTESKVVIIFQIDFADTTDKAIAKVFLQEFAESQRVIRSAPPVSYFRDPPGELTGVKYQHSADSVGYISFALEKRHVEGAKKEKSLSLLTGFRNYLHYHIKCTKTYLHMRMRHKGANWLQVLNRAIPEVETEKKTIAGKTFVRK